MRLDVYLAETLGIESRTKAKLLIERGMVIINGRTATKVSQNVSKNDDVKIDENQSNFASRGGYKLETGINSFNYDVKNKVFLDVGASNGGFTDYLLQNGATKVYAIDVGVNQLEPKIANDERVVVMDNTNARNLTKDMFAENELYAVSDVSFISLNLIIPTLCNICNEMLLLIKPQFECGKKALNKNGIVTDKKAHLKAILDIKNTIEMSGYGLEKLCVANNVPGKNIEYMCLVSKKSSINSEEIQKIIQKQK